MHVSDSARPRRIADNAEATATAFGRSGTAWSDVVRAPLPPAAITERLPQMRPNPPQKPALRPATPPPNSAAPGLRARPPLPAVPWPTRAHRWVRERTQPGRSEMAHDARIADFIALMTTGCRTLATIGPKGGPGKTTVALATGLVLAEVPLARPIVVELNPDWGTIDQVLGDANPQTVQDLLHNLTAVNQVGIGLLQGFVTMWGRLPVLTAPSRPDEMARLTPRDYERVLKLLSVHYNLIILDCGTAFTQRLNQFAIQTADHLQVVGWPDHPTMQKTVAAIDYLTSRRYAEDYRGALTDLSVAEGTPTVRARAHPDITLALNGTGFPPKPDPVDYAQLVAALPGINGVVPLPYSAALRRMLGDGTLTMDAMPTAYRRAVKRLLVAVLGRLAEV